MEKSTEIKIIKDSIFKSFKFNNVLKLNDSSFSAVGSYNNSPAFAILNDKAEIIYCDSLISRIGEFKYVFITPDCNLLLSGYRFKDFGIKSPYFVKTNDSLISKMFPCYGLPIDTTSPIDTTKKPPKDTTNIIYTPQFKVYPNPSNDRTKFEFTLSEKSFIRFKLFDCYGAIIHELNEPEYEKGEYQIDFNFLPFASGIYFYRFETKNKSYTGKLVFYR